MTTNFTFDLEQAFKAECRVIDLKREYTSYRENVRWAIATNLSEQELRVKYSSIIKEYEPFLILTEEHARIIIQFHSNERKHKKRNAEHGDAFGYEDGELEKYHAELVESPFDDGPDMSWLYQGIDKLAPTQQERIRKHYFEGMTCVEIAAQEGVSSQAVQQSIARSLIFLKKILGDRCF